MSVALVCVVSGEAYERYAADLFASAFEFFGPDPVVAHVALPGREGWPAATLYRYHVLLEHERVFDGFDHVFLCDADMRFEAPVGSEILHYLVGTQHPGFVGKRALPFERREESAAFVAEPYGRDERGRYYGGGCYYAGGFVGGETDAFLWLAREITSGIGADERAEITAVWHDESHLNRRFTHEPPTLVLTPSMCYPDDDAGYLATWPERYERKLVALDKTPAERGAR